MQIQVCSSAAELVEDLREQKDLVPDRAGRSESTTTTTSDPTSDLTMPLSYAILDQLIIILQSSNLQNVRDAAWYALGKIINYSESLKQYLRDHVGIRRLTEIIRQSGVVRDRAGFDVMLGIYIYLISYFFFSIVSRG